MFAETISLALCILQIYRSYSVMQSDGNSFWGDVVLDSFNKASRDEDNIVEKKYINKKCLDFYYGDFNFHNIIR